MDARRNLLQEVREIHPAVTVMTLIEEATMLCVKIASRLFLISLAVSADRARAVGECVLLPLKIT
jgi:hypothetical protein